MSHHSKCSILVLSSDNYQPILKIWSFYFNKHWKECPYKTYTVSNQNPIDLPNIKCFNTGVPISEGAEHFKGMMLHALHRIDTPYVLCMVEDQILVKDVITENFDTVINYMSKHDITKVRCLSMPEGDHELDVQEGIMNNKNFGIIDNNNPYRNSLQAAIWNRERLIELLQTFEYDFSGWSFEVEDSFREYSKKWTYIACNQGKGGNLLERYPGMSDSPLMQYVELVRWGLFDRIYIDFFRKMLKEDGLSIDTEEYTRFGAGKKKEELPL